MTLLLVYLINLILGTIFALDFTVPFWYGNRAFTLVLGTVPAGTCSRNTFSVHTISCSLNGFSRVVFPLEQFQLEHGQSMFSEQIAPLVCLRNEVWMMWNREHVLSGRGLARRVLSARRVHVKMTSHVAQCIHNKSYCADRDVCRF